MAGEYEPTAQLRVFKSDLKRLKKYGEAGDSMAIAVRRCLNKAEGIESDEAEQGNAEGLPVSA